MINDRPLITVSTRAAERGRRSKIDVRDLNFYYGHSQILKEINLDIPEKMVTAIIGPSGCGKSTLLRTFNRIYSLYPKQIASGNVTIDGGKYPVASISLTSAPDKGGDGVPKAGPVPDDDL